MAELTENERRWKAHLDAADGAGQTLANYAKVHDLDVAKLYGYRKSIKRKLRRKGNVQPSAFVPVNGSVAASSAQRAGLRIELRNGICVTMDRVEDLPALLQSLVSLR